MPDIYDPWGLGGQSFLHMPAENPSHNNACGCTCSSAQSAVDGMSLHGRDAWMTPKSTPGRTRRSRRTASMSANAWNSRNLHRSSENLLTEPIFRKRNQNYIHETTQAFFNLPKSDRHGLSRSVSCLSSSHRPFLQVEHDSPTKHKTFSPRSNNIVHKLPLSRSMSCLSVRPVATPKVQPKNKN